MVTIGHCELYHADCRDILPTLNSVQAVITDPPYSDLLHRMHGSRILRTSDGSNRTALGYKGQSLDDLAFFAVEFDRLCSGWIVWITDINLALVVRDELEALGRTIFAPLPFYQPGRSARLSGDGPSSWTDWIVVARTKAQNRWGTLPGGYIAGPGWKDKEIMGGKPTKLMDALVSDYSRRGDTVLDSHMGAGTTGVACVRTGRKFIGCEIDKKTFDLACERIAAAASQGSLLEEDHPDPVQNLIAI